MPSNLVVNANITLTGRSGIDYVFLMFPIATVAPQRTGVYAALLPTAIAGLLYPAYVGLSRDMQRRTLASLWSHDKLPYAIRMGATHVAFYATDDIELARAIERDLIDYYKPVLNER